MIAPQTALGADWGIRPPAANLFTQILSGVIMIFTRN